MKPTEIAWAAGFFDGEGHIRWQITWPNKPNRSRTYGTAHLQIAQTDRRVLDRFRDVFDKGKVYGPYTPKTPNSKPYFQYSCAGVTAIEVFNCLVPYLSPVKVLQGGDVIQQYERQIAWPSGGNGQTGKVRGPYKKYAKIS